MDTPRRTTLGVGDARVEMVEHVMAALAGLQIDNCEVWTDQAEMPGCDGSSEPFVRALDVAGIAVQDAPRCCLRPLHANPLGRPRKLGRSTAVRDGRPCSTTSSTTAAKAPSAGRPSSWR